MISIRSRLITTTRPATPTNSVATLLWPMPDEHHGVGPCRSPRRTRWTRRREDIGPIPHHRREQPETPGKRRSSKALPGADRGKASHPESPCLHGLTCPLCPLVVGAPGSSRLLPIRPAPPDVTRLPRNAHWRGLGLPSTRPPDAVSSEVATAHVRAVGDQPEPAWMRDWRTGRTGGGNRDRRDRLGKPDARCQWIPLSAHHCCESLGAEHGSVTDLHLPAGFTRNRRSVPRVRTVPPRTESPEIVSGSTASCACPAPTASGFPTRDCW